MEELYVEGLAAHGGPASCIDDCEGVAKRLQGRVQIGWSSADRALIEPTQSTFWGADAVDGVESNTAGDVIRDAHVGAQHDRGQLDNSLWLVWIKCIGRLSTSAENWIWIWPVFRDGLGRSLG